MSAGETPRLRAELEGVAERLLAASEDARVVSLDAIGEAIGVLAVSTDEVDRLISVLEERGRSVVGPEGGGGEGRLREVVLAARAMTSELGRRPSVAELAARTRLSEEQVRHALALAQVMQR